jgi:hypothetical protein
VKVEEAVGEEGPKLEEEKKILIFFLKML